MALRLLDDRQETDTGRRRGQRVGVIDIGSNSIRLVVFDGARRAPLPIFNEKVLCGIGRRLQSTGRLDPDGVELAIENLTRFAAAARAMGVERLHVPATAAVREAADGPDFVRRVEDACGLPVEVIDGDEEARLSGLGIVAALPEADGIMGDLGGGSLELVMLDRGVLGDHSTLPLGPLRLNEEAGGPAAVKARIREEIGRLPWLSRARGRTFFAVGGAWRSLARVHIAQTRRHLTVIDNYAVASGRMQEFADLIARQSDAALRLLPNLPSKRLDTIRNAALVLRQILAAVAVERVVFSAQGLREGIVFDALPEALRREDPVLSACTDLGLRFGRFSHLAPVLFDWTAPLFAGEEAGDDARLRHAACHLGDLGWSLHPDYRARQTFDRVLTLPIMGLEHVDRAFLALVVFARYAGAMAPKVEKAAREVGMDNGAMRRAKALGQALRLGYTISAGRADLLARTRFRFVEDRLVFELPDIGGAFIGDVVQRRLADLASTLGLKPETLVGG